MHPDLRQAALDRFDEQDAERDEQTARSDRADENAGTVFELVRSGVVCGTCADEGETACSCYDLLS